MFFLDFFDISGGAKEQPVCCPFDHFTTTGVPYKESNASAHVNVDEGLFHCKVCGIGFTEAQFMQRVFDCTYMNAKRLQRIFETTENVFEWMTSTTLSEATLQRAKDLGISEDTIKELKIATPPNSEDVISFPVFMYGHLMDVRNYDPGNKPKVRSRTNCPSGLILPFDLWVNTPKNRVTLICAGEKDMAIARTHGFNAITLTGGEGVSPITPQFFKDRSVAILYDNDGAGINGAKSLAISLLPYTKDIKVVTDFHEVCKEDGEDLTDFFMKYNKTREDLIDYISSTPTYVPTEEDIDKQYPIVDLLEASKPERLNKMCRSNIQVVAVSDSTFVAPAAVMAEKKKLTGEKDTMFVGEFREWELNETNCQDILHLVDNNFKEDAIQKNLRSIMKVPIKERCVKTSILAKKTIFKVFVTDMFETSDAEVQPMEYTAYCLDTKLESGKKYMATYKLVPHPYKGQQLVMIITNVVQANDSVSNFRVTEDVKEKLKVVQNLETEGGTVVEKIELMTEKVKGLLNYDGNNTLIQALDLAYHTVLQFDFGTFKGVRGYLDTIIIGESRVGKSSTADTLRKTYGLGVFTSLAGNSATVPGLIGGSNKTQSGFQTRAGVIPQNHKGLIIFEEFGKSNANVIKELTDIRSSNEVRITRVSGTITLPALVRMIALTNVKNTSGVIKPIASYPNGFSILTELVETAEDIARYDMVVILSDRGANRIDPLWVPEEPLPEEVYQTRIRWVWSRTPEQIIMDREVQLYIMEQANNLNQEYECHIKLFGTEAWKKIARLAIAVAGYVVSTDDTYENIVVQKEHVDFAVNFFIKIYDNPTFKLKEYVQHERRYTQINEEGVAALQQIYDKYPMLVLQLEQSSAVSKNMLGAATGLTNDELNKALNLLSRGLFIRFQNHDIVPTERFRLGLNEINRNTYARRVGED